ncbi:Uncharacterised protein [Mycobacteroides abscessus subsp. abscessus]|nr:Uncharacterised protein [Mycobacteroides abscessus subsp. abscessus]
MRPSSHHATCRPIAIRTGFIGQLANPSNDLYIYKCATERTEGLCPGKAAT